MSYIELLKQLRDMQNPDCARAIPKDYAYGYHDAMDQAIRLYESFANYSNELRNNCKVAAGHRKCEVFLNEIERTDICLFHGFEEYAYTVADKEYGDRPAGQIKGTRAIVEDCNGQVFKVMPTQIRFIDSEEWLDA